VKRLTQIAWLFGILLIMFACGKQEDTSRTTQPSTDKQVAAGSHDHDGDGQPDHGEGEHGAAAEVPHDHDGDGVPDHGEDAGHEGHDHEQRSESPGYVSPDREIGEKPDYVPEGNPYVAMTQATRDTLVVRRDRHHITRDESWPTKGGVLANDYFEVWYARGKLMVTHAMHVFDLLMPARRTVERTFGNAPDQPLVIYVWAYMEDYTQLTGREWWHYSQLRGDTLTYQPVAILTQRGLNKIVVPRQYFMWSIRQLSNDGAPRWLEEGVAGIMSEELWVHQSNIQQFPDAASHVTSIEELETVLVDESDQKLCRIAYYRSYLMAENLIRKYGKAGVRDLVLALGEGRSMDDACHKALGVSYEGMLEVAMAYTLNVQASNE
jgi:hypothetical protein